MVRTLQKTGTIFTYHLYIFTKRQNFRLVLNLPNKKIIDWSKLKAFADDKMSVSEKLKFVLGRKESFVGKGENFFTSIFSFSHNGYQHFFLFLQCFQKASFSGSLKVRIVW